MQYEGIRTSMMNLPTGQPYSESAVGRNVSETVLSSARYDTRRRMSISEGGITQLRPSEVARNDCGSYFA